MHSPMPEPEPRRCLTISVADVGVALAVEDDELRDSLVRHYEGFLDDAAEPELRIEVAVVPGMREQPPSEELRGHPWLDVSARGDRIRVRRFDFNGEVDIAGGTATLACQRRPLSVDGFLRLCFSFLLIRRGGLMLHAASIASRGRGHAFTGPSGAGKTTVCRLSGDRTVLTDETTIVRPDGQGYLVYGNPFPGELGRYGPNAAYPLASVNLLVKGTAPGVEPLPRDQAVRALLQNTFLHVRDSELGARALDAAFAIAREVPVRQLRFSPEPSFWEVIE